MLILKLGNLKGEKLVNCKVLMEDLGVEEVEEEWFREE